MRWDFRIRFFSLFRVTAESDSEEAPFLSWVKLFRSPFRVEIIIFKKWYAPPCLL